MTRSALLVTGDDFGLSHEVNEAVEAQYQAGRLTQASLMIHGPHIAEAQRIVRRNPGLCVGLHLALCASAREGRTPLTDEGGNFAPNPAVAGVRYYWNPALRTAIHAEIEEQFARFLAAGFPAVYWDGHTHLHLHPTIFRETLPVAVRHGFRAVRLVRTEKTGGLGWVFNRLSAAARGALAKAGIQYADRIFGLAESGRLGDADFSRLQAAAARVGLSEIYYHPGIDGPKMASLLADSNLTNWKNFLEQRRDVDAPAESR